MCLMSVPRGELSRLPNHWSQVPLQQHHMVFGYFQPAFVAIRMSSARCVYGYSIGQILLSVDDNVMPPTSISESGKSR